MMGYSFLTRRSDGAINLISFHPPRSTTWHWSISLVKSPPSWRRWLVWRTPAEWRRNQWHDYYRLPFRWALEIARQDYRRPLPPVMTQQDNLIDRLRTFEGSDELGNGDFSVCHEAADLIERLSPPLDAEWDAWRCVNCKQVVRARTEPEQCFVCNQMTFALCARVASTPLDGEGVIQADRDRVYGWVNNRDRYASSLSAHDINTLVETAAAHRRAATISTPREDEVEEEAYEIGKQDGRSEAIQEIDRATGGDGEYRYCMGHHDPERHCPDPETMAARIVERFATLTPREQIRAEAFEEAAKVADRWTLPGDLDGDALRTIARQIEGIATAIRALSSLPAPSSREQRMEEGE